MLSLLSLLLVAVGTNAWFLSLRSFLSLLLNDQQNASTLSRSPARTPPNMSTLYMVDLVSLSLSQYSNDLLAPLPLDFGPSSTYQTMRQSQCTSCEVAQDLSNYWFPKLYFRDPKTGLFESVANGGLLIYYQNRGTKDVANGGPGLKAFPEGFKMISGDPKKRSFKYPTGLGTQAELAERAIEWSCLRYTTNNPGYSGTGGFPTTDCEAGFQSRLHFPACWDGVNVDSPDHKSHVAFLSQLDNGDCPATHPVGLMKLFYEITWDIHDFAGRLMGMPNTNVRYQSTHLLLFNIVTQPDTDGMVTSRTDGMSSMVFFPFFIPLSHHALLSALQRAIDQCNNPDNDTINGVVTACSVFNVISSDKANQCKIEAVVNETTEGTLAKLPGCNPIQKGPGDATMYTDAQCPH
uniref:DUF1996 domain-containing protein n=1 Tax=Armillaria mellea TaxID=47429 RepID=G1C5Z1_ARMME|nr:hypothetical protein [Armillaria mellea]